MKNKNKVSKSNNKLFTDIFGEDMKSPNVEEKDDNIFKMQREQLPLGYRISETFFNYIIAFFTNIVPFALVINMTVSFFNSKITFKRFFTELFSEVAFMAFIFLILLFGIKFIQALVNSILLIYYYKINKMNEERIEKTKEIIKKAIKEKEEIAKSKQEEEYKKQIEKKEKELAEQNKIKQTLVEISDIICNYYLETDNENIKKAYRYDDSFSSKFKNDVKLTLINLYEIRSSYGSIDILDKNGPQKKELENRCRNIVYNLDIATKCILECKDVNATNKLTKILFMPHSILEN